MSHKVFNKADLVPGEEGVLISATNPDTLTPLLERAESLLEWSVR